jgi:hypothetical protein
MKLLARYILSPAISLSLVFAPQLSFANKYLDSSKAGIQAQHENAERWANYLVEMDHGLIIQKITQNLANASESSADIQALDTELVRLTGDFSNFLQQDISKMNLDINGIK